MKTCVCRTPVVSKVSEKQRRCTAEKIALSICFRNSNEVKAKKLKRHLRRTLPPFQPAKYGVLSLSVFLFALFKTDWRRRCCSALSPCDRVRSAVPAIIDQKGERERESTTTAIQDTRQHGHRARQACDTDSVGQGRRRQVDGVM